MDFIPLFSPLVVLIPLLIFVALSRIPWFKGVVGEVLVNVTTRLCLDKTQYHLIRNVTLPAGKGTTQIDHIIVSRFGVFVIETKNMKGWIFGSAHQPYWTQQIFRHKSRFQNPLRQNYKHVKTLEALLGIDPAHIHSLIVFAGACRFKTHMPPNVLYASSYIGYIKSQQDTVLSDAQIRLFIRRIERHRLARSVRTHVEHLRHVRELVRNRRTEPHCPKCNSSMALRTVRQGHKVGKQFWGCSRFPACGAILSAVAADDPGCGKG